MPLTCLISAFFAAGGIGFIGPGGSVLIEVPGGAARAASAQLTDVRDVYGSRAAFKLDAMSGGRVVGEAVGRVTEPGGRLNISARRPFDALRISDGEGHLRAVVEEVRFCALSFTQGRRACRGPDGETTPVLLAGLPASDPAPSMPQDEAPPPPSQAPEPDRAPPSAAPSGEGGAGTARVYDNPFAESLAYAPPVLGYRLPKERIVQLGVNLGGPADPAKAGVDLARQFAPWTVLDQRSKEPNRVVFEAEKGPKASAEDRRNIPLNRHGLPDLAAFGQGPFPFSRGFRLGTGGLNNASNDPDWARWISGRYEIVLEHEKGASIELDPAILGSEVGRPRRETLSDGYVRVTYPVDARLPRNTPKVFMIRVAGGDARDWRRFSVYHTHWYPSKEDDALVPTGDRERHEAGFVWTERFLDLFATEYNAVRGLNPLSQNNTMETHFDDRCKLGDQVSWYTSPNTFARPKNRRQVGDQGADYTLTWDAGRYLRGDHCMGMPLEAFLRLGFEASLRARQRGASDHVVNPIILVPQRFEMPEIDKTLDAIADHVAFAKARGVDYDYVKLELGNEIWNIGGRAFRQDHRYFAGYPKTRYELTQPLDPRYDPAIAARFERTEPWYTEPESWAKNGLSRSGAMRSQGRRLVHLLSRARARHPDINWMGGVSTHTVFAANTRWIMEGAADGAKDVALWAETGDEYGDKGFTLVPQDEEGRYLPGALFTVDVTGYWNLKGGPKQSLLGGIPHEEVTRKLKNGTLFAALEERFLTYPARPDGKSKDRDTWPPNGTLAGLVAAYAEQKEIIAEHGGAMMAVYEADSHTTPSRKWPQTTKIANEIFHGSETAASIMDAVLRLQVEEGFIGIANFAHNARNGAAGNSTEGLRPTAPWTEETDPYTIQPRERIWRKYMTPLTPQKEE